MRIPIIVVFPAIFFALFLGAAESVKWEAGILLDAVGFEGGLIVHAGCGNGELAVALRTDPRNLIQGLDSDVPAVVRARENIQSAGLYGPVSVDVYDGRNLPYADNLISLLLIESDQDIPEEEIRRVLSPRGVVLLRQRKLSVDSWAIDVDGWNAFRKPVPSSIDEWTHFFHGPDNNACAKDSVISFPKHMQWKAGPAFGRHHKTAQGVEAIVSAGGRVFYILDEAEGSIGDTLPDQWRLVARDAFNGVQLWKRPLSDFDWRMWTDSAHTDGRMGYPKQRHRRLVAIGDRVYVTLGLTAPVSVLDAATGETLRVLEGTEKCSEIIHHRRLFLSIRHGDGKDARYRIVSIDPSSGQRLWGSDFYKGYSGQYTGFADLSLTAGEDYVLFQDDKAVVCLDSATGRALWENVPASEGSREIRKFGAYGRLLYHDGMVFLLNPNLKPNLYAFLAETGRQVWSADKPVRVYGTTSMMFVAQDLLWVHDENLHLGGLDPRTGKLKRSVDMSRAKKTVGGHIRCYPGKATERSYWTTIGGKPQQMIDLDTGKNYSMPWLRGACRVGILPCNGLVYMTPHPCMCHVEVKLKGLIALASDQCQIPARSSAGRLIRGPAYDRTRYAENAHPEDWPVFRHDPARSNVAGTSVSAGTIERSWQAEIGGKVTQPTVVAGVLYTASTDAHTVHALKADSGEHIWSFCAGGRIDSAVTYYRGRVLFGCRDGRVYCLGADDGSLVWRFSAAPAERRIVVRDQLESIWPVQGSVLIKDDKAIVVAGRTSYLDGGIHLYMLDFESGKVLKYSNEDTTGLEFPENPPPGFLPDILVNQGEDVFMHFFQLDLAGEIGVMKDGNGEKGGPGKALKAKDNTEFLTGAAGMLHGGLFHRAGLMYGRSWGYLMAISDGMTYAVRVFQDWNKHNGPPFTPGVDSFRLLAQDAKTSKPKWSVEIPFVARAMLLAGDRIFVAGAPGGIDEADPWQAFEGRGPGELRVYSRHDGRELYKHRLSAVPVHDGMSAAGGELYITLNNGSIECWR